jgi:site-specific recombinase XerD
MKTNDMLAWFRRELSAIRGASEATMNAYCDSVGKYAAWMQTRRETDISAVLLAERNDLLEYRQYLALRLASASIARHFSALKRLYQMLTVQHRLAVNPYPEDMCIRIKSQEPTDVPTAEQFAAIRKWVHAKGDIARIALLELLAGSGLRIDAALTLKPHHLKLSSAPIRTGGGDEPQVFTISELAKLKVRDFILVDSEMACKGKYAGSIPITPAASGWLRVYMQKYPPSADRPIFDINYKTAYRMVVEAGRHAEPSIGISPHALRHLYCAMTYYQSLAGDKRDILATQHAMGHSDMKITSRYLRMAERICQSDDEWREWANGPAEAAA